MDDGEEAPKTPERPKLGPPPSAPEEPESYGRAYYSMNTAQKLASSKPDRDKVSLPKARGGWTFFIVLAAAALFFYWNPTALTSALDKMKEWVFAQREEIFSKGAGYGELPKDDQ